MPTRTTRPRKEQGLRKYIIPLLKGPAMRFLAGSEWDPVADLIWGPAGRLDKAAMAKLRKLWLELREPILEAQAKYMPNKKPWGCRFDRASG
jgi:hypothetical protein